MGITSTFRPTKKKMPLQEQREAERRFRAWITTTRDLLLASGIPLAAWSSLRSWGYFVEHADLPYELDASRFSVHDLTPEQSRVLREILERDHGKAAYVPTLLARLRHESEVEATRMDLSPPWHVVFGEATRLEEELRREVGPGHILWKQDLRAVARRLDQDDVLFADATEPQLIALVRLTWSGDREPEPRWPETMVFTSWEDWWRYASSNDAEERGDKDE